MDRLTAEAAAAMMPDLRRMAAGLLGKTPAETTADASFIRVVGCTGRSAVLMMDEPGRVAREAGVHLAFGTGLIGVVLDQSVGDYPYFAPRVFSRLSPFGGQLARLERRQPEVDVARGVRFDVAPNVLSEWLDRGILPRGYWAAVSARSELPIERMGAHDTGSVFSGEAVMSQEDPRLPLRP